MQFNLNKAFTQAALSLIFIPILACTPPPPDIAQSATVTPNQAPEPDIATLDKIWSELERMNGDISYIQSELENLTFEVESSLFETATYIESIQNTNQNSDETIFTNLQSEMQDLRNNLESINSAGYVDEVKWSDDLAQINIQLENMSGVIESLGYDSQLQLTDQVTDLNSQLEEIWRSIETIQFDIETSSHTSYIDGRIEEVNTQVNELTSSIRDELSYRIESLESEMQTLNDTEYINILQQEIHEVRSLIPYDLQYALDTLNTDVENMNSSIGVNNTDIQAIKSDIVYLGDRLDSTN